MSAAFKNRILRKSDNVVIKNIAIRFLVICLINLIAVVLLCSFFYFTDRNVYDEYVLIVLMFVVTDFMASYYVGRRIRKNGMICGVIYNLPLIMLFETVSLILNNFSFDSRAFILPVLRILISAIGGITAVNAKGK